MYGGGQQNGTRPGTENASGVCYLKKAVEAQYSGIAENRKKASDINKIISGLAGEMPDVYINKRGVPCSPYILNMSFSGVKGETLVNALSEQEIYISMGAACRSKKNERSPLLDMGFDEERAVSAVRFSFSRLNTIEEAEIAKEAVKKTVDKLRAIHNR
jgi:cysteine desulfurase